MGFLDTIRARRAAHPVAAKQPEAPTGSAVAGMGALLLPLALAQFIASYAGSNMNVAISDIAGDLDTTVTGVQTTITIFTLTMAALTVISRAMFGT